MKVLKDFSWIFNKAGVKYETSYVSEIIPSYNDAVELTDLKIILKFNLCYNLKVRIIYGVRI